MKMGLAVVSLLSCFPAIAANLDGFSKNYNSDKAENNPQFLTAKNYQIMLSLTVKHYALNQQPSRMCRGYSAARYSHQPMNLGYATTQRVKNGLTGLSPTLKCSTAIYQQ